MTWRLEAAVYLALLAGMGALVGVEGRRRAELERRVPVAPAELYRTLARSQTSWQVVDVRADLSGGYEDSHIPGAIPLPGCDAEKAPAAARDRIYPTVPTVLVSSRGDGAAVEKCLTRFAAARRLAGGMQAWDDASLPEDSGEYSAPSVKAGGGCL